MTWEPALLPPLGHAPSWSPAPQTLEGWRRLAAGAEAPAGLAEELRWHEALAAGRAGDWAAVSRLAEAGLAEPWSEREAARLAFLHCLSGAVEEAEHVLSQAIQLHGDAGLARAVAGWCEAGGLLGAAARLRAGAAGPAHR
jgi:hypothetical protein